MRKELDRLMREPDKDRRNYHITKRCQICKQCVVGEMGKHIILYKCKLDGKWVGLTGVCDVWEERE